MGKVLDISDRDVIIHKLKQKAQNSREFEDFLKELAIYTTDINRENSMDYKCPACGVEVCEFCGQCCNSECADALCPQYTGAMTEDVWEVIEFDCPECGNVESILSDRLIHGQVPGTNKSGTYGYEYCSDCGAYILVIV